MLCERLRHLSKKGLEVTVRLVRDLLEIDGQSLKLVGLEKLNEFLNTRCPCRWISEKPREPGSVPPPLHRVLDHGQNRNVRLRYLDVFQRPVLDVDLQVHGRTLKIKPAGDEPVEMGKRPLKSGVASVVPVHVEADAQGPFVCTFKRHGDRATVRR